MDGGELRKALDDCRDCLLEDIERQVSANLKVLLDVILEKEAKRRQTENGCD